MTLANDMRYMITLLTYALMSGICFAQQDTSELHPVSIPYGIKGVTPEQKRILAAVTNLPLRATPAQVQQILGSPAESKPSRWFYDLPETRTEGGYFITVDVYFVSNRVDTIKVAAGDDEVMPSTIKK